MRHTASESGRDFEEYLWTCLVRSNLNLIPVPALDEGGNPTNTNDPILPLGESQGWICRGHQYRHLYGTSPMTKLEFIVGLGNKPHRIGIEAKTQKGGGTTDQKLVHVVCSAIDNLQNDRFDEFLIALDGFDKSQRAIEWLERTVEAHVLMKHRFSVLAHVHIFRAGAQSVVEWLEQYSKKLGRTTCRT
jgi:hypothetical protein